MGYDGKRGRGKKRREEKRGQKGLKENDRPPRNRGREDKNENGKSVKLKCSVFGKLCNQSIVIL
jgi:hypothetical protein